MKADLSAWRKAILQLTTIALVATTIVLVAPPPIASAQLANAADDTFTVVAGETTPLDVLANDTGADRGPLSISAIVRDPDDGSATISRDGTQIEFVAPIDFAGTSFIYEMTDDASNVAQATVTVNVDATCRDINVTAAQGGDGLEAAIVLANRCPGAQTIFLERGTYTTAFGFSAVEDDLTITALDSSVKPQIVNLRQNAFATTLRVTTGATLTVRSLAMFDSVGAAATHVFAQNATLFVDQVDITGQENTSTEPFTSAIRGDNAVLNVTQTSIINSDATAIAGINGTTLNGENITIVNPPWQGIEVDGAIDIDGLVINAAGRDGIKAGAGLQLANARIWSSGDAAISVSTTEPVDISASTLGLDLDDLAAINRIGITGQGPISLTDVVIANTKEVAIKTVGISTLTTTSTTISATDVGLDLNRTEWTATTTSVDAVSTGCVLFDTRLTDDGSNSDTDGTCFPVPNQLPVASADTAAASPGETIDIDVLANDADPDGDLLIITAQTSGSARIADDGFSITYTAADDFAGETFGYTIDDGNGGTADAAVTVELVCGDVTLDEAAGGTALAAAVEAADACPGAQTIFLGAGTYRLSQQLVIDDALTVQGLDPDQPSVIAVDPRTATQTDYVFFVNDAAATFVARNIAAVGSEQLGFAYLGEVDATLDNVTYTGTATDCRQGVPNAVNAQGTTLLLTNAEILQSHCDAVIGVNASVTMVASRVSGAAGDGIDVRDGTVTVRDSVLHDNGGAAVNVSGTSPGDELIVDNSILYLNGAGISSSVTTTVLDATIGMRPVGEGNAAAGNLGNGIEVAFADLTVERTIVSHNGAGVSAGNQSQWQTMITDSTIESNTTYGLRIGPNNNGAEATGTTFGNNTPSCEFQTGSALIDGGGNTDDDGTCGFFVIPDVLVVNTGSFGLDTNPGDGICSIGSALPDGELECSLRAAIDESNALEGRQTVIVESGRHGVNAAIPVTDAVTVRAQDPANPPSLIVDRLSLISIFTVTSQAGEFEAHDLVVPANRSVSFGNFENVTVELSGIQYTGEKVGCSVGIANAMTVRGGSLTLRDSTIIDASCSGVQGFLGASVTIEDSTIAGTNGQNVRFESGPLEIVRSVISDATGVGINTRGATALVRETQVFGNGSDGIYASGDLMIVDSFIGSAVGDGGGPVADGNGGSGVDATFANLTIENTLVANNTSGVISSGQVQWSTDITNSQINNNTATGLRIGSYNTATTVTNTELLGNAAACALGRGAAINDGGGNSVDDDTCGFAVLATSLDVIDQIEGAGRRVLATLADPSLVTTATFSSVAGSAAAGVDYENLVIERVDGGWQVVATLLDNSAGDGDRVIEIEVTLSDGTVFEGAVTLLDDEAASDLLPTPFDYVDECARRSQALADGFGSSYDALLSSVLALPGLPFDTGAFGGLFDVLAPPPPADTACAEAAAQGSELLHGALQYTAPVARDEIESLALGETSTFNVLSNDGHSDGQPLRVVPTTVVADGFEIEIRGDGTAVVSATSTGSTTVSYDVCAGDSCRTAQLTVQADATLPPVVQADWISVNGGEDRRLGSDGRGPIDATRNDRGDGQLRVASVDAASLAAGVAGPLVGVAVPQGQAAPETVTLTQTVCTDANACASAPLYVLANPDDAPLAPRGLLALPAAGSASLVPVAEGTTGNFIVPTEHLEDIAVVWAGTSFDVAASPGFRGHAAFLYETCASGGSPCSWGVIDVIAASGLAPVANDDSFTVDVRNLYLSGDTPGYAIDVVGSAGGGADVAHGGVPRIELVDGGIVTNAQGTHVATIQATPPSGVAARSHVLWVVPTPEAVTQDKAGASGTATYRMCVAGTELCDTATVSVTLDVVPVGTADQSEVIPLWRVDNSGVSVEGRAPLFDAFLGDSPVIDRRNAFLLSVLSEYVYEELPGSSDGEFEDRFASAFAGSGLSNSQFYETSDTPLGLITDAQVLITETDDAVIVVARGSESALDWINNFTFPPEQGIHAGFRAQADAVTTRVVEDLETRPADKPVWFTGHSLGGAVTQILASRSPREVQGVVTFGSPSPFAAGTNPNVPPTVRYVNGNDPVPSLLQELGYDHVGAEEWITADAAACATSGPRPSGAHLNFSDHSMSRYMPRMLRLLTPANQQDLLGRYVSFDWMKWDSASGSPCDAPMSVARQDVVGTWQWGIAPQASQSTKADEFVAGSWIVEVDNRLVEVPAGVRDADAVAALTDALTWTVPSGRGDIVFDEAQSPSAGARWLYRPIASTGQAWEPSPRSNDTVILGYTGCNPWTSVCGDGTITITFVPATDASVDLALYGATPIDVLANDAEPLAGVLPTGASLEREIRSLDGEVLEPGQRLSFIGGDATISANRQNVELALDASGLRPPITVLDYQACTQIVLPGASVRGTFESCADAALWLFETELPSLDVIDVTVGPCDAVLDPGTDVSLTTTTALTDLGGIGTQAAFPASVQSIFDFLDVGVQYRWSATGELVTQLGVDGAGPYLGECSGLGVGLQADAVISLPDVSIFEDLNVYAAGAGTFVVTPTGVNRLDGSPVAASASSHAAMTVGANATVGPLTLDLDALLVGDQTGVTVADTVLAGELRLPGFGDAEGASRLDLAGTIDGSTLTLTGAGTLDGADVYLDGFEFDNVAASFTVDTATEQVSGTVTGDLVIDMLDTRIPIVFSFDGSRWSLAADLPATDLVIGAGPELLRIEDAAFTIGAAGDTNDATLDLTIGFESTSGQLLPSAGGAVAQATGISGLITSSGFITLEAASVTGEFGGFGLAISDATFVVDADKPDGLIAEFGRIDGQIGGADAVSVVGVAIFANGDIDIDGVCIAPDSLLPDSIGAVGFPVRIIEACVVTGDLVPDGVAADDEFVTVTAELVLDSLAQLDPTVTIGDAVSSPGQSEPFEFSAVLADDRSLEPWAFGPVSVDFRSEETAGITTSGEFTIGGIADGAYSGALSGFGELDVDLPGVGAATFAAELTGNVLIDDNGDHVMMIDASIDATGNTSPALVGSLPIELDTLTATADITAVTTIGADTTSTVEVSVSGVAGSGSLSIGDGNASFGSADVSITAENGVWQFALEDGTTVAGDAWVTIHDATGTIMMDTNADPWTVDGGFGAEARFAAGLVEPAAVEVVAETSWDGARFAIAFAASDDAAIPPFGVGELFATSTNTPVAVTGGLSIDTTTNVVVSADLALGFGPTTATLFPDRPEFTVTATGLTGTLDATGIIASAEEISGTFANGTPEPYELAFAGPVILDLRPGETLLFESDEATLGLGATAVTVFGVKVTKDGMVDFTGLCGSNSAGLIGETFGVAGLLPVRITEACVISGSSVPAGVPLDATYVEISGSFDFNQIDQINPYVKIGDGAADNTFTEIAAIRYDDGSWALWNVGPIVLGFGPTAAAGVTVAGEIALGGYGSDGFEPSVEGTASADVDLPGVATGDLIATFAGEFSTSPTTTSLVGAISVVASEPHDPATSPALVSLESLDAVANVSLIAQRTESSDDNTIWSLEPTIELVSASGAAAVALPADQDTQLLQAQVDVAYSPGLWTFDATGQAATPGDLGWFAATSIDGELTIDTSIDGRYDVDGALTTTVDIDFDGVDNGSPAVEVDTSIDFRFVDGVLDVALRASNPTPETFTIDGLLEVQGATIEVRGGASFDTTIGDFVDVDLAVDLDAAFAALFPGQTSEGIDATVSGIDATLSSEGFRGFATGIAGTFGSELDAFGDASITTGAATLTIDHTANQPYAVLTVNGATITVQPPPPALGEEAGEPTVVTVGAVAVNSDRTLDISGACADNQDGLIGQTFGIAGALPFDVTQACVLTGDGVPDDVQAVITDTQRFATVSGAFDFSGVSELNPSITVGTGANHNAATNVFTFSVLYSDPAIGGDGSVDIWNAGPIALSFGPVSAGGVTASGDLVLGGYVDGEFIADVAGTASAALDLPGAAAADFVGTLTGDVDPLDGTVDVRITIDGEAAASLPGDDVGFVSLDQLYAELDLDLQASVDPDGTWSTAYSVDVEMANAAGTIGLGSGDGQTFFGGEVTASYASDRWTVTATGAAAAAGSDWLGFAELSGAVEIDLTDEANPDIAGVLQANASLDIDGDGPGAAASVAARVDFETNGPLLTAAFSGSSVSPIDVVVDGVVAIDDVSFTLVGDFDLNIDTLIVERFNASAEFGVASATLFPGVEGFNVTAQQIAGAVDGDGLVLGVESIEGVFGPTELEIGPAELTLRPRATEVYEVVSVGFAQLITNGVGAEVTDVVVRSDGGVSIGGFCLEGQEGIATQTFGVAGVLPFDITEACVLAVEDGTTIYSAAGFFDFSQFTAALGPEARVTGRIGSANITSDLEAAADANRFTVEFIDDGNGLRPRNFGPFELEVSGVAAGPFEGSLGLFFGGYQDGMLAGSYHGEAPAVPTPLVGGSFEVSVDVDAGDTAEVGAGIGADIAGWLVTVGDITTLHLEGSIAGSGTLLVDDFGLEIVELGADFAMQIGFNPVTNSFSDVTATFDEAGAERLLVGLGFATLEAEGVELFPAADLDNPAPAGVQNLFAAETVAMTFTDKAAVLAGWGASVDDIRVQYSEAAGLQVCAGPNFATAFQSGGEPDLFGWMPLTIDSASFELPDPSPEDGCDSVITRLGNFAEASIVASLTLGESDQWPISASVDGVGIEVALLVDYVEWLADGAQGTPPDFPITQLEGLAFGMAPTNFGPLTLGGQIGIGYIIDESGRPVWYGRLGVAADWNNIGLTLDIGASQYGPMWATISTPFTIPLGPTGFTITGIGGGLAFDRPWPTVKAGCNELPVQDGDNPSEDPDCANALDLVRADIFELKAVAPTTQAEILAMVEAKAAQVGTALDGADLAQQVWAFLPKSITLNLHGTINHATGVFDGTVTLGGNIDIGDLQFPPVEGGGAELVPDFALLGKGELSFFGFEAGELGIMMDYENPIDPTFAVALGVPGDGTLASFFPGGATFGGTLETTGMYSVWYLIARELAVQLFEKTTDLPGADTLFDDLAVRVDQDRNRPLAQLLLDGQDPDEIDGAWVRDRILELIPDTTTLPTSGTALEDQILADLLVGGKVAEAFVTEVFDTLANGVPGGPLEPPQPPAVDAEETIAAFQEFVKDLLLDAPADGQRLLDVALATMDPKLEIVGEAGLEIFGLPVGPQQGMRLAIDKQALTFDYNGSPLALLDPRFALLVQEDTTISFNAPWDLEALVAASLGGDPVELPLDPFSGSWGAGFDSVGTVVGLPYGAAGFVSPAGNATFVQERLNARPADALPIDDDFAQLLVANGGMLFDVALSIPDLFSDPAALADDLIALGCFDNDFTALAASMTDVDLEGIDFDEINFDNIDAQDLTQLQQCFVLLTKTKELGSAQLYTPNPGPALGAAFDGWAFEDGMPPELQDQLISAFDGWYLRGEMNEFELFGFPVIDTSADPDNGTFEITQDGVIWGVQTSPFLTADDAVENRYQVNMRLPFLSAEGEPLPVSFDVIETPVGPAVVPALGGSWTLKGDQIADLMDTLGVAAMVPSDASATLRAYTPGYDRSTAEADLRNTGGVQISTTGPIGGSFAGLVEAEKDAVATASLTLTPPSPGNLIGADVAGEIVVDGNIQIGAVTLAGGTLGVDYTGGISPVVTVDGDVDLEDLGEFAATGTIDPNVPRADLTLVTESLQLNDDVSVAGTLRLETVGTTWQIVATNATLTIGTWRDFEVDTITIASDGSFAIDELMIGDIATPDDPFFIEDFGLSVGFSRERGLSGSLLGTLVFALDSDATIEIDLAELDLGARTLPVSGSGAFGRSFAVELEAGELDFGSASVSLGRTADGVWYAELDARIDLDDLGIDGQITVEDLRADSTGTIAGQATLDTSWPVEVLLPLEIVTITQTPPGAIQPIAAPGGGLGSGLPIGPPVIDAPPTRVIEFRVGESYVRTDGTWFLDLDSLPQVRLGGNSSFASPVRLDNGQLAGQLLTNGDVIVAFSGEVMVTPLDLTVSAAGSLNTSTRTFTANIGSESLRFGPLSLEGGASVSASPQSWSLEFESGSTAGLDGWGSVTTESGTTITSDGGFMIDLAFDDMGSEDDIVRLVAPRLQASYVPGEELDVTLDGAVQLAIDLPGSGKRYPCVRFGDADVPSGSTTSSCTAIASDFNFNIPTGSNGAFADEFTADLQLGDWDFGDASVTFARHGDGAMSLFVNGSAAITLFQGNYLGDVLPAGIAPIIGGSVELVDVGFVRRSNGSTFVSGEATATLDVVLSDILPGLQWNSGVTMGIATRGSSSNRRIELSLGDASIASNGDFDLGVLGSLFGDTANDLLVVETFAVGGTVDVSFDVDVVDGISVVGFGLTSVDLVGCTAEGSSISGSSSGFTVSVGEGRSEVVCTAEQTFGDLVLQTDTLSFDIMVVREPPIIKFPTPEDVTVFVTGSTNATSVNYPGFGVEFGSALCVPASGSSFAVGTTTVTCTASNNDGSTPVTRSFDVTVAQTVVGGLIFSNIAGSTAGQEAAYAEFGRKPERSDAPTDATDPLASDANGRAQATQGEEVRSTGKDTKPGTLTEAWLRSEPVFLGSTVVDADGRWTLDMVIPSDMPVGAHTLILVSTGRDGVRRLDQLSFDVVEPAQRALPTVSRPITPPETPTAADPAVSDQVALDDAEPIEAPQPLAHTGSSAQFPAQLGLALVGFGALALGCGRRRRRIRNSAG